MNRPRRVAVTAPDGPPRSAGVPAPDTATLDPATLRAARRIRRVQLRRAAVTLVLGGLLLLGLPVLLRAAPDLGGVLVFGIPGVWLVLALLPYPLLAVLAWWQLAAAERAEQPEPDHPEHDQPEHGHPEHDRSGHDHEVERPS